MKNKIFFWFVNVSLITSIIATIISFFSIKYSDNASDSEGLLLNTEMMIEHLILQVDGKEKIKYIKNNKLNVDDLNNRLVSIERRFNDVELFKKSNKNKLVDLRNDKALLGISKELLRSSARITELEALFISKPEIAITLPLLKNDMVLMNNDIRSLKTLVELQSEMIQEANNQARFAIGTLCFGVFGILVTILISNFHSRQKRDP
jgi:hypothetical protein